MHVRIMADRYVIKRGKQVPNNYDVMATSFDDVENAVRLLNGTSCTLVMLIHHSDKDNMANLCITGGTAGQYLVTVTKGIDKAFFTLLSRECLNNQDGDSGEVTFISGGQEITILQIEVVDFETALTAAKHWAEHEEMLPSLHWRLDKS